MTNLYSPARLASLAPVALGDACVGTKEYDMNLTTNSIPASQALQDYGQQVAGNNAHMKITPRGTWVSGDIDWAFFSNRQALDTTTEFDVMRAWTCDGITHWTLEKWTHDNGYQCTLVVLTKAEFIALKKS